MLYFLIKAAFSGIIVAIVSETARRSPGVGALIASLPLISLLGMIWLWRDTRDAEQMMAYSSATFWYVLPSLPMFLLVPALMKRDMGFWPAIVAGCALTIALYAAMTWAGPRIGIKL
jgi:F0F1-type ATP synthase assembly protein I